MLLYTPHAKTHTSQRVIRVGYYIRVVIRMNINIHERGYIRVITVGNGLVDVSMKRTIRV